MSLLLLEQVDVKDKRVLLREDLNLPLDEDGKISNDIRLKRALPTINYLLSQNAAVIIMSHLGRPKEGQFDSRYSLKILCASLEKALKQKVRFVQDWQTKGIEISPGEVVLCENVRFNVGEKANAKNLAQSMAQLCDVFVMDAFASSHRAHASTCGVASYSPIACAGPLLSEEISAIESAIENPKKPVMAIIGGSKVSTKLTVIENIIDRVDFLILGGGLANTFLLAQGKEIGKSLVERDMVSDALSSLQKARERNCLILLPIDIVNEQGEIKSLDELTKDDIILDVGPRTQVAYANAISEMRTILWNGPIGVFEKKLYQKGTRSLALAIANSGAYTVAGGGDTIAAIDMFGISDKLTYISTGGGAFLELLEGKRLPALDCLQVN